MRASYSRRWRISPSPGLSVRPGSSTPASIIIRRPAESSDGEGACRSPLCSRSGRWWPRLRIRGCCPDPLSVGAAILADIRSGELPFQMACTLARVLAAFSVAFSLGVVAGYAMGRSKAVDRYADPWLIVLLNLPALVVIIFAYVWIGLNETAAIVAVALNKLPNVIVVTREGVRSLDRRPGRHVAGRFGCNGSRGCGMSSLPQLAPYLAAVSRSEPVDQLEDRAGRRTDRTPQWRRVRSGVGVFAVRYDQDIRLCDLIRGTYARDRNPAGATA